MEKMLLLKIFIPIIPMKIWMNFFHSGRKFAGIIKRLRSIVSYDIQEKKKQHADFLEYTANANELSLLDSMLYLEGKQMSQEQIFEEILLFSFAATDTSGHAMAFCFTCLGMYPKVQETVYNEVMTVIGHNTISNDDLPKLKYTEAVVLETLRIFPSGPFIGRYLNANIDVGTRTIPKGTNYVFSVLDLHRNPKYWPNPFYFDPTRFLPENRKYIQPYTYIPFSAGPRDCMGKEQAMMLMKTTVANVVRNFRITSNIKSVENIRLTSCITMKSTHPLDCHFTSR